MHTPCMPKIEEKMHATQYLQVKPVVANDPDVLLHFPSFPLTSCSKFQVCDTPPTVLQEKSKCPRV